MQPSVLDCFPYGTVYVLPTLAQCFGKLAALKAGVPVGLNACVCQACHP
jgi:hypothetical protein